MRVQGRFILSSYDPKAEAKEWVEKISSTLSPTQPLLVLGLGLGYHVLELKRKGFTVNGVVEPDPALVREALKVNPELAEQSIQIFSGKDPQALGDSICSQSLGSFRILPYEPLIRLNPPFYRQLLTSLTHQWGQNSLLPEGQNLVLDPLTLPSKDRLNVIVVAPIHGGSLPIARYVAAAFRRLGHSAELIDPSPFNLIKKAIEENHHLHKLHQKLVRELVEFVIRWTEALAVEKRLDLVFFLAQAPVKRELLTLLRRRRITTAFWFVEDFRTFSYWREWAHLYDHFFVIQEEPFISILKNRGVKSVHYLPLAADPTIHRPIHLTEEEKNRFGSPISHVGIGYRNRRQIFTALADLPFKIWGDEWKGAGGVEHLLQENSRRLNEEETVKVFNASLINLNLHSSSFHNGINPDGDFLNPRTFEICGCGGFQLVDYRHLLPRHFQPGKEVIVYRTLEELQLAIKHYLQSPEERETIAQAGKMRVFQEHTYDHRILEAIEIMGGKPLSFTLQHNSVSSNSIHQSQLLANELDSEALQMLNHGSRDGHFDLLKFAEEILNRTPRPLNRAEMIAL
ncbi:MAG: glycosyltransferase, partial [bacterium]